jgi:hypothetical protein
LLFDAPEHRWSVLFQTEEGKRTLPAQ